MLYYISANTTNIGDFLSNMGIQKLIGVQGTNVYCDRTFVEQTKKVIRGAQSNDVFIIGGGGLFKDHFMPFWNEIYKKREKLHYVLWGIGINERKRGGLKHLISEKIMPKITYMKKWKEITKKSMISSFRDENTYRHFRSMNNCFKIGCPSINFILDHKRNLPKRLLIHSCNQYLFRDVEVQTMQQITNEIASKLALEKVYTNREIKGSLELQEWLDRYSSAEITISSSLHGCILALTSGSKLIAVSRDWKIEGFLRMVDLMDAICDINEIEKKALHLGAQKQVSRKIRKIKEENEKFAQQVRSLIAY